MKAFRAMLPLFVSLAVLALVGAQEQTATQQANFSTIPPLTYNATGNNVILRDVLVRGRIWENCPGVQGNQTGGNQTSAAQAGADQLGLLDSANLVPKTQFAARVREFNISQMQFSFVVQPDCPGEQAQNQQNVSEVVNMWPANFDSATFVNSSILVDMIQPCSQSQNQTGGQQSQNWGGVSVSIQQFQASNLTARILLTKTCNGAGQVQGNQTGGNATTPSQADQGQGNLTQSQQVSPANGTFQSGNQTWAFTIQDVSLQSFNATVEVSSNNCTQLWQQTVGSDSAPFPPGQAYNQSSQNPFFQDIIVRAQFGRLASSCSSNLTQSNETAPGDVNQVPMALPTVQVLNSLNATAFNMTVQQVYAAISLFCSGGNQTSNQTNTTQADQSQNMQMYGPLVFTATNLTADAVHAQVNVSDVCPSQNVQSGNSSQAMQDQASFVRGSWLNRIRRMLG